VARNQGWTLDNLSVSRRWRFQVGSSRWTAQAYVSFFFYGRPSAAVYAIHFEGTGSVSALESSALVQDLRTHLGTYRMSSDGKQLAWKLSGESRPRRLLAEMDQVAHAFGTNDHHRAPPSRSRAVGKRLAVIAEVVLAHGTWSLETPDMWLRREDAVLLGAISPMPSSARGRADISSGVFTPDGKESGYLTALVARAESRGYVDRAGNGHPDLALMKLQPLSLRAALTEARFIETEVSEFSAMT
jgi:hypothetical protein